MKPIEPMQSDYYARLGLTIDATPEEVRRAYHRAARLFHPDASSSEETTKMFLEVQEAYEVLSDAQRRAAYQKTYVDQSPILLRLSYSRPMLRHLDEPQLIYVLLEMLPHPNKIDEVRSPALNVCLVIDRSTSMRGERIDLVKESAIDLIRHLRAESTLSIVAFSDRAEVLLSAGEQSDPEKIETRIRMLQPSGGTEIYQGLEAALSQIRRSPMMKGLSHILLLTDGRTYGDEQACFNLAETAAREGVGITTLGIGNEWNITFLENLAAQTGGRCIYISQPAEIGKSILEKIHSLGQTFATNVQMDIQMGAGASLRFAFRLSPETNTLTTASPLRLGNLFKRSTLQVLLEFYLDPIGADTTYFDLAECQLSADFPATVLPKFNRRLLLGRPVSDLHSEESPPTDILNALERLILYRMQEEARREIDEQNIAGATRHLRFLADRLFHTGQTALAQTVLIEAHRLEQGKTLSLEGEKIIKYGTRALLLPQSTEEKQD
jgi:Ca-activated chloride channel family protein